MNQDRFPFFGADCFRRSAIILARHFSSGVIREPVTWTLTGFTLSRNAIDDPPVSDSKGTYRKLSLWASRFPYVSAYWAEVPTHNRSWTRAKIRYARDIDAPGRLPKAKSRDEK
jgi:hypothetical protein